MSDETTRETEGGPDITKLVADEYPRRPLMALSGKRREFFQAVIRRDVLQEIHAHGLSTLEAEVCGVLVGNVYRDDRGPYLHIHASIRGDKAEGHAAQVTFTSATWDHIHSVMEKQHPDAKIVGWYHTHPGFGIFLSGMDLFIQDNFFNLPWQVAFVYDPVGKDEGMFVWRGGKSEREPFLIEEPDLEDARQASGWRWKRRENLAIASSRGVLARLSDLPRGVMWTVCLFLFLLSFTITYMSMLPAAEPVASDDSPADATLASDVISEQ
jgi:proteasome lid subunit RPN8/RPN11